MTSNYSMPHDELHRGSTDEQLRRLTVLHELTTSLIAITDFKELLNKICDESVRFFNARGAILRLLDGKDLRLEAHTGLDGEIKPVRELGEGLCGMTADAGKTIFYNSPFDQEISHGTHPIQVGICTPLKIGETLIGTFALVDKKGIDGTCVAFNEDDRITIEGFASVAAIVIEKSILFEKARKQEAAAVEAREQAETLKDYLTGLIENSPDAIVTTDMKGIVTSWNEASEKTFGYSGEEAIGSFVPNIPSFLIESERHFLELIERGESIKDLETVRKTKDGRMLDISLNMAPIKDSQGKIIGVSRIGRDITEKKRAEKDISRKNSELSKLLFISRSMRGTLELDRLIRMVLTAVTLGDGLGFNRAMLFLIDEGSHTINGAMGVGPANHDEAWEIWSRLSMENKDIHAVMADVEHSTMSKESLMDRLCRGITVDIEEDTILTRSVKEKQGFNVADVLAEPLSDAVLIQQLGTMAYAVVPLISMDRVIGVLWVDNLFSRKPITDHDMEILRGFTDQIAAAIENARLFEKVTSAEQEMENIFESISDLLHINDAQFNIKRINRAVSEKIGLPPDQIIGKKCHEIFHGMDCPWEICPHLKTIQTRKPCVSEVDDPHLGGTYVVSTSPLFDKNGILTGTVHIARDVTEIKKLKEKFVSIERMAALGEMAAKVAHEIRNPLLAIGGFARRLEKTLALENKEQAKIIVEEVRRLEGILNNTLSFVRTAATEKHEVHIEELINAVTSLLAQAVAEKGNLLQSSVDPELYLTINFDRIKEALLNLVNNANNATENGTITIGARINRALADPDLLGHQAEVREGIIEISDDGYGIKEEDLERIFDPFFTTRATGTGLGLSITKRIIEEHGGRIEVESSRGKGTKFFLHIPIQGGAA